MKTEIMIAVLALLCIGSLAAVFVLWAKLDEQKKATEEERDRRWDEISRAVDLENIIEDRTKDVLFLNKEAQRFFEDAFDRMVERNALQDCLSALLCPTNNHVWKDGVCVKCGRMKDG